ncbi:hypothetical protein [Streptomyces shenzhenensis]|uniref:Uncharacterized protein n=1 Tax=Streptomyces shenzhenensis TaxID=943815 RepID=A0A3M0ISY0_9ACTN|nr:hypothetical protein [Streptomyces shenzhenensis]RMB85236.1 hypothetical protein CTZ28_13850 [Streptomyces shenzhenensis]
MKTLRRVVRWSFAALVPGELVLVLCLAGGVRIPAGVRPALESAVLTLVAAAITLFCLDRRRHRRDGLDRRAAFLAAIADTVPAPVRTLAAHELVLSASLLRWVFRRGSHGVRDGDLPVRYAAGQTAVMFGFLFVCVVETVALALLIPWPVVHAVTLVLDIWGCYFVLALHASCVVRPHVIGADGSLRLRYGALVDIRIPADRIASVRPDRKFPESRLAAVDENGVADLAVGGQTTVTVELTEPVRYVRVLGRPAEARAIRFYADDAAPAVAALRAAGTNRTADAADAAGSAVADRAGNR